jgi:hypothetical protein
MAAGFVEPKPDEADRNDAKGDKEGSFHKKRFIRV